MHAMRLINPSSVGFTRCLRPWPPRSLLQRIRPALIFPRDNRANGALPNLTFDSSVQLPRTVSVWRPRSMQFWPGTNTKATSYAASIHRRRFSDSMASPRVNINCFMSSGRGAISSNCSLLRGCAIVKASACKACPRRVHPELLLPP